MPLHLLLAFALFLRLEVDVEVERCWRGSRGEKEVKMGERKVRGRRGSGGRGYGEEFVEERVWREGTRGGARGEQLWTGRAKRER